MSDEVRTTGVVPMPALDEPGAGENGELVGHAMLAVGYDDSQQQFIFRNSWSDDWGMHGYGTMPYTYFLEENLSDDFWTINLVQ